MIEHKQVVHVVDDDESLRTAMQRLLQAADYQVCTYASAGDFIIALNEDTAGCLLLDVCMPGPSGLQLQDALVQRQVNLPIIFLAGSGDIQTCAQAMKAGASDFLAKPADRETLLGAIRHALATREKREAQSVSVRELQARFASLTSREREIFSQVIIGRLNKQIASDLGISERTVKVHRAQVMEKMQVTSLAALVRLADQLEAGSAFLH